MIQKSKLVRLDSKNIYDLEEKSQNNCFGYCNFNN